MSKNWRDSFQYSIQIILMIVAMLPGLSLAANTEPGPTSGSGIIAVLALIVLIAVAFGIWHLKDWIEAKADEARERARKMKLENDRLELDNKAKARDLNAT